MVKIDSKRKKSFRGAYEQKINLCAFFSWRLCVKCPAKSKNLKIPNFFPGHKKSLRVSRGINYFRR
jgi:hypothetical protein